MKTKKKSGWMKGFIIAPRITDDLTLSQIQAAEKAFTSRKRIPGSRLRSLA